MVLHSRTIAQSCLGLVYVKANGDLKWMGEERHDLGRKEHPVWSSSTNAAFVVPVAVKRDSGISSV